MLTAKRFLKIAKAWKFGRHSALFLIFVSLVTGTLGVASTYVNASAAHFFWDRGYSSLAYYTNHTDAALAIKEGFYYFGGGQYDLPKAVNAFTLATKLEPNILWGHYQLARIYFVQGRWSEALAEINAELAANPQNLRALYERGLIETSMGNLSAAEADFTRFIAWAPSEWGGYNDGAYVLAKEGKYVESEALIEKAFKNVSGGNTVPWLWNGLGLTQLNLGRYAQAEQSFTKALELADRLTTQDWVSAYTANDPAAASASIAAFQTAVQANITTAHKAQSLFDQSQ